MKKKKNYDIAHKVMRVRAGDYALLAEIARQASVPMAEALHLAITDSLREGNPLSNREPVTVTPRTQIPMLLTTAYRAAPTTAIATNGNKAIAFRIKTKGVKRE